METLLSIAKGLALALATIGVSHFLPQDLFFSFFAVLLTFAAGVYVGFAIVDKVHLKEDILEVLISLVFLSFAIFGLWFSPLLIAIGWALHGLWDLLHHLRQIKTETGKTYPLSCLIYDFVVAWYVFDAWIMTASYFG